MNITEKLTAAVLLVAALSSASLYGVWEDKTLLFAPLVVLIYCALAAGLVSRFRGPASSSNPSSQKLLTSDFRSLISGSTLTSGSMIPPGGIMLLLFWLYSACRVPFCALPHEAAVSTLRFGAYLGTYWASANLLSRFPRRKAAWILVFTSLILIALYSLVQHKIAPNCIFGQERYTGYWEHGRLGGTYQCPNHIAHLFQMGLPFCIVFLLIRQFGWFWRICFAYAVPLFLLLIYQTQSRAGILGVVAGLVVTGLMLVLRKSRRLFLLALLILPLLGAGALGGLWVGSAMFRQRMTPVVRFIDHVVSGAVVEEEFNDFRPQTWLDSLAMYQDHPIIGFGPGSYGTFFEGYRQRFKATRIETVHPHNEYIELLVEYGLVGALMILAALICAIIALIRLVVRAERPYHALPAAAMLGALAGTAVHGFFDFELRIFPNALMLAFLAGSAVAPIVRQRSEAGCRNPSSGFLTSGFRMLTAVLFLLAAIWSLQVMGSAFLSSLGDQKLEKLQTETAIRLYTIAKRIDGSNWGPDFGLGRIYSQNRYYELDPEQKSLWASKELEEFRKAYQLNSRKEEIVYGLARAEQVSGNQERALELFRLAAQYKPFNDFYWRKLGIELRKAGLYNESMSAFERAYQLNRSNQTVRRSMEWLRKHQGDNQ
ncbi:MAG: O-antigen ligase family protein [Kiritimatiellales bacterium]